MAHPKDFFVDKIMDIRESFIQKPNCSNLEVNIKWLGYGSNYNSWEQIEHINPGSEVSLLSDFFNRIQSTSPRRKLVKMALDFVDIRNKSRRRKTDNFSKESISKNQETKESSSKNKLLFSSKKKLLSGFSEHESSSKELLDNFKKEHSEDVLFGTNKNFINSQYFGSIGNDNCWKNKKNNKTTSLGLEKKPQVKYESIIMDYNDVIWIDKLVFKDVNGITNLNTERVVIISEFEQKEDTLALLREMYLMVEKLDTKCTKILSTIVNIYKNNLNEKKK